MNVIDTTQWFIASLPKQGRVRIRPSMFIVALFVIVMAGCRGGGGGPPPSVQCANKGGDWNGLCCIDEVNPGYTSPPCEFNSGYNAYCGKDQYEHWKWAPAAPAGAIYKLPYCFDGMLLGNGTTLVQCGGSPVAGIAQFPASGFVSVNSSGKIHEYYCSGSVITECRGEQAAFSENKTSDVTGDSRMVGNTMYYCASDADWTADLDTKDDTTCGAAGFTWTGSLCCSDANHPGDYYNDPAYPNATGGCWNKVAVASGDFAPGATDRVINYHGRFFGCHVTEANILSLRDTHKTPPDNWLVNTTVLACATALMDAQPGGMPNAVCHTDGLWKFTDKPVGMINKSIAWAGLVNLTGILKNGCCGYDQCWDGKQCQLLGSHYRIADQGFVCTIPPVIASPTTCVPSGCIMPECQAKLSPECAQAGCIPTSCFSGMENDLCVTPGCRPATPGSSSGPGTIGGGSATCIIYPDGRKMCVA